MSDDPLGAPKSAMLAEGLTSKNLQKGLAKPAGGANKMSSAPTKRGLSSSNLQAGLAKPATDAPAPTPSNPKGSTQGS